MSQEDVTRRQAAAVPELQGKAKHGNVPANPIIAGTHAPALKVYHSTPHKGENQFPLHTPPLTRILPWTIWRMT